MRGVIAPCIYHAALAEVLAAEFIISMNFLRLYDIDTDEWHYRRIFWVIAGLCLTIPVLASCLFATFAAIKYLW